MPLPSPVLDHLVIDVRDQIDEAMRRFSALGFQLTPRGRHTLGSVNHLLMFTTDYLELLGFGESGATRLEIARFPAGLNGLVFKTTDAEAVYRDAEAAGLPVLPVQAFSRPVALDGATRDARFRTTRLDPDKITIGRVYFCEHLTPELVWRPEWQAHPNGASAITRMVVATADPQRTAVLFRDLFGGGTGWAHRVHGGSRNQGPIATGRGATAELRAGRARRAASGSGARERRVQHGYRVLGVSDGGCGGRLQNQRASITSAM